MELKKLKKLTFDTLKSLEIISFEEFTLVYQTYIQHISKLMQADEGIEFTAAFQLSYDMANNVQASQQQIDLLSLIYLQSYIRIGDQVQLFQEKNVVSNLLKLAITERIQQIIEKPQKSAQDLILMLFFINIGFPIWKISRDHVPEYYSAVKSILIFLDNNLKTLQFQNYSSKQQNKNLKEEQNFEILFEKYFLNNQSSNQTFQLDEIFNLIRIVINVLKNTFKFTNGDINFDMNNESILANLVDINDYLKQIFQQNINLKSESAIKTQSDCQQIIDQMNDWFTSYRLKNNLDIIIDKPLVRIRQLDPKIDQFSKKLVQDDLQIRQNIKKKIRKTKNALIKEIKTDEHILDNNKQLQQKYKTEQKKKIHKQFMQFMEESHIEVKKMASTQIVTKRFKRKNKRMAGNKVQNNVPKSK